MTFAAVVFADMVRSLVFQTDKTTGLGRTLNYKGQLNQWLCDLMTWSKVGCRNSKTSHHNSTANIQVDMQRHVPERRHKKTADIPGDFYQKNRPYKRYL